MNNVPLILSFNIEVHINGRTFSYLIAAQGSFKNANPMWLNTENKIKITYGFFALIFICMRVSLSDGEIWKAEKTIVKFRKER